MTGHQASRAEHQGTEAPAPRCNIYNCFEEATHTVDLPASSAGRAATVRLCPPCYSDWEGHLDFDRLRGNVDLVRARPPQEPGGGMAAVERDVIEVPRDRDAKRLLEDILKTATHYGRDDWVGLAGKLDRIKPLAARLAERLAERDAEREGLVALLREQVPQRYVDACIPADDPATEEACWTCRVDRVLARAARGGEA